jgi:hypothetical protein
MMWLKWVSALLLVLAGVEWFSPGAVTNNLGTFNVAGYGIGALLGVVAVALGLWQIYELAMKR